MTESDADKGEDTDSERGHRSRLDIGDKLGTFALDVALESSPIESDWSAEDVAESAASGRSELGEITAKAQRLLHGYAADVRRRRREITRNAPEVTDRLPSSSHRIGGVDTDDRSDIIDTADESRTDTAAHTQPSQTTRHPHSTRRGHIIMTKQTPVSPQPHSYRTKAMSQVVALWSQMSTIERRALMAELDLTEAGLAQRDLDALAADSLRRIIALESAAGEAEAVPAADPAPAPSVVTTEPVDEAGENAGSSEPDDDEAQTAEDEVDLGAAAAGAAAEVAGEEAADDDDDEPDAEAQMEMMAEAAAEAETAGGDDE